ncbi:MAG: OadG family protein [Deltaproteobacteria bacterium]|nr:OadG family protein [Deltaproteobacteria bacterium]
MQGFEAISHYNGLAMAIVGVSIVFMGLVVLSFAISQIHRLLIFWEDRDIYLQRIKNFKNRILNKNQMDLTKGECLLDDIKKTAQSYVPLIDQLDKSFQLVDLYNLAQQNDLPHPHLTITKFRNEKLIIPEGAGSFTWNFQLSEEKDKG